MKVKTHPEGGIALSSAVASAPQQPAYNAVDSNDEAHAGLSITQVVLILRAYWKQAAVIFLGVAILGAVGIKLMPKSYTATATLKVDNEFKDPLAGELNPIEQRGGYIPTEIQLMQSTEILLTVVDRLHLTQIKDYAASFSGDPVNLRQYVKERLRKDLDIEQGPQNSLLINLTAAARNPVLAAAIANAVADAYVEQERQRIDDPASERARRYAQQLAELKSKVSAAEEQVAAFRQRTGITDPTGQKNIDADALTTLEQRLQDATNARRIAEVKAERDPVSQDTTASHSTTQELESRLSNQQAQLAQLRTTLGGQHPKVLELLSQINVTKEAIAHELQSTSRVANGDLAAARQLEMKLELAVSQQRAKVLAAGKLQDQGNKFMLELESAKSVYKRALDGYDQIMFASAGHYTYVDVVSRAVPAINSTKPNKVKLLAGALFAALALGLGAPLGYELFLNRRVRCGADLERGFQLAVLIEFDAYVPEVRQAA